MLKYFPNEKELDGFNEFLPPDHIPVAGLPDAIRDQKRGWLNTISVRAIFSSEVEDGDLVIPVSRPSSNDWHHPDTVWVPALSPDAQTEMVEVGGESTYRPKFYGVAYKAVNRVLMGPIVYSPKFMFKAGDLIFATTNGKVTTEETGVFVGTCLAPGFLNIHGAVRNIDILNQTMAVYRDTVVLAEQVAGNKASVDVSLASINASEANVTGLAAQVMDYSDELTAIAANISDFYILRQNLTAITTLSADLQGFPIYEFDGGRIVDPIQAMNGVGGVLRVVAENIDDIKKVADSLENSEALLNLADDVAEIGGTDYTQIDETGNTEA